ncbi:LLM class flavin-dependent oxidoreductase [Micromonospora sp. NPDC050397]|uniref:LLM class flavin-dependent oxidoreductase n=1 Tax=Micromonospora sp. NPDC050397 TaxID=3364279 RepID=UPI00384B5B4A
MTIQFGVSLAPTSDVEHGFRLAAAAELAGLDLIGVQDHPYVSRYVDAFVFIGQLLARTHTISVFPDVTNLPLRPPAMLALTASSLARVSEGRFVLGLGAGGYWDAITSMGVPRRTPAEGLRALAEAVELMRELWETGREVTRDGEFASVSGLAGHGPAVPVWVGAQGPHSFRLTGRLADGWAAPIPSYLPYERWAPANATIDRAAQESGRSPASVTRVAQIVGTITDHPQRRPELVGAAPIRADVNGWVEVLERLATEQPFTTFVLWPETADERQIRRFGEEVAPMLRARLDR